MLDENIVLLKVDMLQWLPVGYVVLVKMRITFD